MSKEKQYRELVRRYLDNKASDDELEVFFHLLKEGKLNSYLEEAMAKNEQVLFRREEPSRVINPGWIKWVAAAMVVAAIGTVGLLTFIHKPQKQSLSASVPHAADVLPGHNHAILTLAGGGHLDLDSQSNAVVKLQGHSSLIRNQSGAWVYHGAETGDSAIAYDVLSAPRGGQFPFVLDDGTKVWLNAASSLTFPTAFRGSVREVTLDGEAYFEVAPDAKRSFVVKTRTQDVRVLGTAFNVNAYPDENQVRTTLISGKVRLERGIQSILMEPGQLAYWNDDGAVQRISDAEIVDAAVSWKHGYFSFAEDDIQTVMRQISRWYDVDIRYEGSLTEAKFGGDIERDLSLMQVLQILEKSQVHFRLQGKVLTVLP